MGYRTLFLKLQDETEIFLRCWAKVEKPKGIVQIAHGMAEHSGRYARFARKLNEQGYLVLASDHRGHGHTGEKSGKMGWFAKENGFDTVVNDLFEVNQWAKENYPNLPHYLLGHSMGSFLTRRYLQIHNQTIDGAIIMGSGGDPGKILAIASLIAEIQKRFDPEKPSKLLDHLTFSGNNKGIEKPRTKFDWLSRDPQEVDLYLADPFCGIVCSSGFFSDLFQGLKLIHDQALIKQIPKDFPILVVSGEGDPVGKYGEGIKEFVALYEELGLTNIETIFYPGARHELLNETNREEVTNDLLTWLTKQ